MAKTVTLEQAMAAASSVLDTLLKHNRPREAWKKFQALPDPSRVSPDSQFIYQMKRTGTGIEVLLRLDQGLPSKRLQRLRDEAVALAWRKPDNLSRIFGAKSDVEAKATAREAAHLMAVTLLVSMREKDFDQAKSLAEWALFLGNQFFKDPEFNRWLVVLAVDPYIVSGDALTALKRIQDVEWVKGEPHAQGELRVKKAAALSALDRHKEADEAMRWAALCLLRPRVASWYPGWLATKRAQFMSVDEGRHPVNTVMHVIGLAWDLTDPGHKSQRRFLKEMTLSLVRRYGKADWKTWLNDRGETSAPLALFGTIKPPRSRRQLMRLAGTTPGRTVSSAMRLGV